MLEKTSIVRGVSGLLCVRNDLVKLSGFSEACDDLKSTWSFWDDYLVRDIGAQVHGQCEIEIVWTDGITEFL